jgi:hypothetical protein
MGYRIIDARDIGERRVNSERYNTVWPTEPCLWDDDGSSDDIGHQLLHTLYRPQHDVALEDGLTIDDSVLDLAVAKGVTSDHPCAHFWARPKLF